MGSKRFTTLKMLDSGFRRNDDMDAEMVFFKPGFKSIAVLNSQTPLRHQDKFKGRTAHVYKSVDSVRNFGGMALPDDVGQKGHQIAGSAEVADFNAVESP